MLRMSAEVNKKAEALLLKQEAKKLKAQKKMQVRRCRRVAAGAWQVL
jgi:hypothetical protein